MKPFRGSTLHSQLEAFRDLNATRPTVKDSPALENATKPRSTPGTSESNSNHNTNTRSNPVCLEVAVTIRSLPAENAGTSSTADKPIQEEARTVIVFENGAVLRLAGNFP